MASRRNFCQGNGDVLDMIIAGLLPFNSTLSIIPLTFSPFLFSRLLLILSSSCSSVSSNDEHEELAVGEIARLGPVVSTNTATATLFHVISNGLP